MPSLHLEVFAAPRDVAADAAIRQFVASVNAEDFSAIRQMNPPGALRRIEQIFLAPVVHKEVSDGALQLSLRTRCDFEPERLARLLRHVGAARVEISAFDSDKGDLFYIDDDEAYWADCEDPDWRWIKPLATELAGQQVVVTGTVDDHSRTALNKRLTLLGAKVLRTVNKKTTLLVVGTQPESDAMDAATQLGIRVMDATQLMALFRGEGALTAQEPSLQTLADQMAGEQADSSFARVVAYRYVLPPTNVADAPLHPDVRSDLAALLRANGWTVPEPATRWDVAGLFDAQHVLITRHAPYVWEADTKGYGHAFNAIMRASRIPVDDVQYVQRPGATDRFTLSCTRGERRFEASFKHSNDNFPLPFLRLLLELAACSSDWAFVFCPRPQQKSYALIPRALAEGLLRHAFVVPLAEPDF